MLISPKKMLLIDGIGALFSAFLLGVILAKFEPIFGMPQKVLHLLSIIACAMACYSFLSFWLVKERWEHYLKIIAYANLAYCIFTGILAAVFIEELTTRGLLYFIGEAGVIITLALIELKIAARTPSL
jgi:hypothetical protein